MSGEFTFKARDNKTLHAYRWDDAADQKAVLQIFHGMAEHAGRYADIAGFLNKRGYIVYAHDHRGHGKTAGDPKNVGYIGQDGFNRIVEDEHKLHQIITDRHKGLPVFVLAHSFGSFIGQEYIMSHGADIKGILLTGTARKDGFDVKLGRVLAPIMLLMGGKRKSFLINWLAFSAANSRVPKPRTYFDWISRDEAMVDGYVADPFCGTVFTTNFYYWFFKGLSGLYKREKLANIPKGLPIYILSGDNDPIGSYGKSPKRLLEMYKGLGIQDVNLKLYEGARHEIINETNRQEVYEEIAGWLDRLLGLRPYAQ